MTMPNRDHEDLKSRSFSPEFFRSTSELIFRNHIENALYDGDSATVTTKVPEIRDALFALVKGEDPNAVITCDFDGETYWMTVSPGRLYVRDSRTAMDMDFDQMVEEEEAQYNADGEEVVTNEHGGMQSKLDVDMTLLADDGLARMADVMTRNCIEHGGSYPRNNWRKISRRDHLAHGLKHLMAAGRNDEVDMKELAHAGCRIMFALSELVEDQDYEGTDHDEPEAT